MAVSRGCELQFLLKFKNAGIPDTQQSNGLVVMLCGCSYCLDYLYAISSQHTRASIGVFNLTEIVDSLNLVPRVI
jgi:hypothetical protein